MLKKVYSVTFRTYTNAMRDTICDNPDDFGGDYINVGKNAFLIFEDDIEKYRKFGNGIDSLIFVGNMEVSDSTSDMKLEGVVKKLCSGMVEVLDSALDTQLEKDTKRLWKDLNNEKEKSDNMCRN